MAKRWKDVRRAAVEADRLDEGRIAEHKERALAEVRAQRLADIRTAYGLNQEVVAARLDVTQSRISRLERGDVERTQIATLRAYIRALGGELEVTARFGDERITVG